MTLRAFVGGLPVCQRLLGLVDGGLLRAGLDRVHGLDVPGVELAAGGGLVPLADSLSVRNQAGPFPAWVCAPAHSFMATV